jgi:hypothetical protein
VVTLILDLNQHLVPEIKRGVDDPIAIDESVTTDPLLSSAHVRHVDVHAQVAQCHHFLRAATVDALPPLGVSAGPNHPM